MTANSFLFCVIVKGSEFYWYVDSEMAVLLII